jgi:hypothetical protein
MITLQGRHVGTIIANLELEMLQLCVERRAATTLTSLYVERRFDILVFKLLYPGVNN